MHGGKGSGAPRGNRNAWKHGWYSGRIRAIVRYLRETSPENFGRRVAAYGLEGAMEVAPKPPPRPASIPAAQKIKNKKFEHQPHAPGFSRMGRNWGAGFASAIDGVAPSPPEIPASAGMTRWRGKLRRGASSPSASSHTPQPPSL
jgi:hypothetical protein